MKLCIIIGFNYELSENITLPGAYNDIINIFSYCSEILPDKIILFSDYNYKELISRVPKNERFDKYHIENNYHKIYNVSEIISIMNEELHHYEEINEIFIYFSGHSKNDSIIMPNNDLVSINKFYNIFINTKHTNNMEIFIIHDSCNHQNNENVFNNYISSILKNKKDVILYISSSIGEKSACDINGSFFTSKLIKLLYTHINLNLIISKINNNDYNQTSKIYSNITKEDIWRWISYVNYNEKNLLCN